MCSLVTDIKIVRVLRLKTLPVMTGHTGSWGISPNLIIWVVLIYYIEILGETRVVAWERTVASIMITQMADSSCITSDFF